MAERVSLDPAEGISGRTEFDLTDWIDMEGVDWGDAEIEAFLADRDRGSVPVDFRIPNRTISIPLKLVPRGGTTALTARADLQAKAAMFQREGGIVKRTTATGPIVYADVVNATFSATSVSGWESRGTLDIDAHLSLEVLPDFYQAEVTLSDHVETTNAELIFTEVNVAGDYPARVRIVVDDDQAQDQRGLIWAFRSRYYDSASTATLQYEAESLGVLDTAAKAALSGASGGTVVTHGTLSTNWTPVLSTNVAGTQFLTHKGTYRLYARVYSTSGTTVQARAVWDVGDLVSPAENDAWRLPGASNFYTHDFGELRLDAPPVGTYRWQGQIQAKGDVGGENFSVDKVWFVPVDEGMGVLTSPLPTTQGLATYSSRSEFNTEGTVVTGGTAAVGGVWAGAGDATDFAVASTTATRVEVSDADTNTGRYAASGVTAFAAQMVRIDTKWSAAAGSGVIGQGVLARYTDANNWLRFVILSGGSQASFQVRQRVAGGATTWGPFGGASGFAINSWVTLLLYVDTKGFWEVWAGAQGGLLSFVAAGQSTDLATGGALATGKPGFTDFNTSATVVTRTYDNFAAWVPSGDAVTFASRSTQLTTDGHYRLDSGGTAYGPVSIQAGDLPRLPVAGLEGRTTEVFLKSSRGDFDQLPDSHTTTDYGDDISARVFYSPSWLFVPNT